MKKPVFIYKVLLFLMAALLSFDLLFAQSTTTPVKDLVASRQFLFRAEVMLPSGGNSQYLTSEYDLRVYPDSIAVYLPYFGRAYSATYGGGPGGGLQVYTRQFRYRSLSRKKGWSVRIDPADSEIQQLFLTIGPQGSATLTVASNNRQSIAYHGRILPLKR